MTTLSKSSAWQIEEKILEVFKTAGIEAAYCICDAFGDPVVRSSMGVATTYSMLAGSKSYTAATHKVATISFRHKEEGGIWVPEPDGWDTWEIIHTAQHDPRFCGFGGGVPLIGHDDEVVGGIGISALTELEDHLLADQAATSWRIG